MRVFHAVRELAALEGSVRWALGFFDGVHLGHQRVIGAARQPGALCGVLTFTDHPLALLAPERRPPLLTPDAVFKERALASLGVDALLLLPFTRELAALEPLDFLEGLAEACPHGVAGVSVGAY